MPVNQTSRWSSLAGDMACVTTFHPKEFERQRKFVDHYKRRCSMPLIGVTFPNLDGRFLSDERAKLGVRVHDYEIPNAHVAITKLLDKNGWRHRINYYTKWLALKDAALGWRVGRYRFLVWLDNDVKLLADCDELFTSIADRLVKENKEFAYLGRKYYPTSETGFMVFDGNILTSSIIDNMVDSYLDLDILYYPEFHDSYHFDRLRTSNFSDKSLNLSPDEQPQPPDIDVMKWTFGKYMEHYKGNRKKDF